MAEKQQTGQLYIRIFYEDQNGHYRDDKLDIHPDDFGGLPAVGDVILDPAIPPINDAYESQRGFWEVVKRYFKPFQPHPYVVLVVRERSRSNREIDI